VLLVGLPIGTHFLMEVGGFTVATLIAGRLGEVALGAHTVVLNLASLTFMLPLGISIAAATRVGNLVGAQEFVAMRHSMRAAFALGISVMGLCGLSFIALRTVLPRVYTDNPELLALAAAVLPIAAAFQISDGTQVVSSGVLRGMGRTFAPAITNLLAYYALGLPLGYYFTFTLGYGLPGLWWGLAIALTVVAIILSTWTVRASKNPIRV
jgi:MATE family multidrug resistance protein